MSSIGAGTRMMLIATCCVAASILGACLTDFGSGSSSSNYMLCNPQFAEESPCAPECDASSVVIIDGINYCTSTCGPNGECQVGHVCVMFGMFDTPKSACLPPCRTGADCPDGFLGICGAEGVCGL